MADVAADVRPDVAPGAPAARDALVPQRPFPHSDRPAATYGASPANGTAAPARTAVVNAGATVNGTPPPNGTAAVDGNGQTAPAGCTQAQLRRFIKSRPYVPMHELRRRFELNGSADEVSPMTTPAGCVYVGLPARESQFVAELVRMGDIGLELSHDPPVPVVIGVYAMRPISR